MELSALCWHECWDARRIFSGGRRKSRSCSGTKIFMSCGILPSLVVSGILCFEVEIRIQNTNILVELKILPTPAVSWVPTCPTRHTNSGLHGQVNAHPTLRGYPKCGCSVPRSLCKLSYLWCECETVTSFKNLTETSIYGVCK
jgi:hypothetical protein